MKVYETTDIRNLAVVGHGDAGKTSLVSALLYTAGAVNRLGKVEEGNAVTDFEEEEIERKISLGAALGFAEWNGAKLNLVDTPGYANFLHEARGALRVVETALVTVCGVEGVGFQTRKVWGDAEEFGCARCFVVNRLDRERADFAQTLAQIQEIFGREAVALHLPIGREHDFAGLVDLVAMKAYTFEKDGDGKGKASDIPADLAEEAQTQREALMEMVAEADEALLETYLEAGELDDAAFRTGLQTALRTGKLFPVLCASATHNIGTSVLLDFLQAVAPSPDDAGAVTGVNPKDDGEVTREPAADAAPSAYVFKTLADPYAGKITCFRVYSGVITADAAYYNATKETEERLGAVFLLQGKDQHKVQEVRAGDLGAVAKLKEATTGDTFCEKGNQVRYAPPTYKEPAISFALEPKSRGDEDKIMTALHRIMEEDVVLRAVRDPQTKELVVSGTGQLHVEVAVARIKKKFGVEVILHPPKVPYRETITRKAGDSYRHKKQTGGAGQFAEVHMDLLPLERGQGFEFDAKRVFGGAISSNFFPSIEKGIKQVLENGPLTGCQVVDVRCEVFDGKMHPVDSKDIAFQIAGRELFKQLFAKAKPVLLEPIMQVEVTVPEANMGDIMGELNSRRGRVQGMDAQAGMQTVKAQAPLAEMLDFMPTLNSITGGQGDYQMELSHYEIVPAQVQGKLVEKFKAEREAARD